jgi:hypothetical protein
MRTNVSGKDHYDRYFSGSNVHGERGGGSELLGGGAIGHMAVEEGGEAGAVGGFEQV